MSFLLVIPIEPIYWSLALPAGLLIGYYANARSDRAGGPVAADRRQLAARRRRRPGSRSPLLLLVVKVMFFNADNGYPTSTASTRTAHDPATCQTGADCVYQRYLAAAGPAFEAAGITDVDLVHALLLGPAATRRRRLVIARRSAAAWAAACFGCK